MRSDAWEALAVCEREDLEHLLGTPEDHPLGMELPSDFFVKPVDGQTDLFQFRFGYDFEGQGSRSAVVTERKTVTSSSRATPPSSRASTARARTSLRARSSAASSLPRRPGRLCATTTSTTSCSARCSTSDEEEGKGLKMKARVDGAIRTIPNSAPTTSRSRTARSTHCRSAASSSARSPRLGKKIVDMDFTEISVTPVPVHPGTNFAVVAGKALASDVRGRTT
jgi:hypothetical protein